MFMLLNLSLTFLIFFIGCKPLNINNNYSSGNSNTPIVPPAGDEVKKGELLSTIATKQLENDDLDKFTSLTQEQLNEVLVEVNKKDPAYKKDLMLKILAENKLNNFVKNNNLDDEFIKAMKTDDKDNYAFSNALLESALKDDNGIDKTVKKDIVKKVFALQNSPISIGVKGINEKFLKVPKLGKYALNILDDDFTNDATKNKVADNLTKIFALGNDTINDFYAYITPQSWGVKNTAGIDNLTSRKIIRLILEKDLLKEIVKTDEHAESLINIVGTTLGIDGSTLVGKLDDVLALDITNEMIINHSKYNQEIKEKIRQSFYDRAEETSKNKFTK